MMDVLEAESRQDLDYHAHQINETSCKTSVSFYSVEKNSRCHRNESSYHDLAFYNDTVVPIFVTGTRTL